MRRRRVPPSNRSELPRGVIGLVVAIPIAIAVLILAVSIIASQVADDESSDGKSVVKDDRGRVVLTVAYSPEKADLFERLAKEFNGKSQKYSIRAIKLEMDEMLSQAVQGKLTAISPDSAIWLGPLDQAWQAEDAARANLVGSLGRYALSPVVVAMWESQASAMGYPGRAVGWNDLVNRATSGTGFRWSHPSTSTAAGLLTTTAEFYAARGKTSQLTKDDLSDSTAQQYVRRVERTIQRYGGESEDIVLQRLLDSGSSSLDAFVGQEATVVRFNRLSKGEKLVAVYPYEGTLWMDHPLALLEGPWLTAEHRRGFQEMVDFFRSAPAQKIVMQEGYRPADLAISLDDPDSQIKAANGVDPAQPQTMLQMPTYSVLEKIRAVWALLKRSANIYLVADVSGSMEGEKLIKAKEALLSFVNQVVSDSDQLALVTFASSVKEEVPLGRLSENRERLVGAIDELEPRGNTALYDAILFSVEQLSQQRDEERINAVLVMSDGRENASRRVRSRNDPRSLIQALEQTRAETEVPVMVFSVAYGDDADLDDLRLISESTHAQAYQGNTETIRKLYQLLSAFFN